MTAAEIITKLQALDRNKIAVMAPAPGRWPGHVIGDVVAVVDKPDHVQVQMCISAG